MTSCFLKFSWLLSTVPSKVIISFLTPMPIVTRKWGWILSWVLQLVRYASFFQQYLSSRKLLSAMTLTCLLKQPRTLTWVFLLPFELMAKHIKKLDRQPFPENVNYHRYLLWNSCQWSVHVLSKWLSTETKKGPHWRLPFLGAKMLILYFSQADQILSRLPVPIPLRRNKRGEWSCGIKFRPV